MTNEIKESTKKRYDDLFKKAIENGLDLSRLEFMTKSEYNRVMKTHVKKNSSFESQRSLLIKIRNDNDNFNERLERYEIKSKREKAEFEHEIRIETNKPFFTFTKPNMKYNTTMSQIPTTLPVARKRKEKFKFTNQIGQKNFKSLKEYKKGTIINDFLIEKTFSDINQLLPTIEQNAKNLRKNIGLVFAYQWYDPKIDKVGYDTFELQTGLCLSFETLLDRIYGRQHGNERHDLNDVNSLFYKTMKGLGTLETSIVIRFYQIDIDLMIYE